MNQFVRRDAMGITNLLKTYKGLSKEVYVLFIGRIVNSLGAFVHPLMALILTQKLAYQYLKPVYL